MVTNDSFYCYLVTIKLINCPCHHGADGLLEPTAVFCFVLSWRHNNVTLGIGTVWRMTSFAVVQSPVAVKDRVLTPFLVTLYRLNCNMHGHWNPGSTYLNWQKISAYSCAIAEACSTVTRNVNWEPRRRWLANSSSLRGPNLTSASFSIWSASRLSFSLPKNRRKNQLNKQSYNILQMTGTSKTQLMVA